jgi:CBS domain containing-hemolysin-like protein
MSASDVPLVVTLVVLLISAVVLAAAEASLLRVRRVAVEVQADAGSRRATRLLGLIDDLPRVLNAVLLTVLLVQIGAATVTGLLAERYFGTLGITLSSMALTVVMFVYAEAIPKTYAVRHPLQVAQVLAVPVALLSTLLRPIVTVLVKVADLQAPGVGIVSSLAVSEEELRRLAAEAATAGEIDRSDLDFLERSFRLGDARVGEVIVPRIDVMAVRDTTPAAAALAVALERGHRRIPVHQGDLDQITGVLLLRDLAAAVSAGEQVTAGDLARPMLVVPETNLVIDLLTEMQRTGLHFAVVVDEHGGTAGIATIEDVVGELVGGVSDEGEVPIPEIAPVEGGWSVDAGAGVVDLGLRLGVRFPDGDYNTVGGLVLAHAGRILSVGESVDVAGYRFLVTSATRRRIRRLLVRSAD